MVPFRPTVTRCSQPSVIRFDATFETAYSTRTPSFIHAGLSIGSSIPRARPLCTVTVASGA